MSLKPHQPVDGQIVKLYDDLFSVSAKSVRVGDRIYNKGATYKPWEWITVTDVFLHESGSIVLRTSAWDTWKHPEEAVTIRR